MRQVRQAEPHLGRNTTSLIRRLVLADVALAGITSPHRVTAQVAPKNLGSKP